MTVTSYKKTHPNHACKQTFGARGAYSKYHQLATLDSQGFIFYLQVKNGDSIHLLFHEAYHNYIKSLYPCADQDAIILGGILMHLHQGSFDQRKAKHYLAR